LVGFEGEMNGRFLSFFKDLYSIFVWVLEQDELAVNLEISIVKNMDKEQFFIKLKQNITSVFNNIEEKDDLFEFGIFTDQDISTILIGYNTYTHFANHLKERFLEYNIIFSSDRWEIPEWYKCIGDESMFVDEINDILYNVIQPKESEINPNDFKVNILDLLCNALLELKTEGLFDSMKKDSILYLQQADSHVGDLMKQRIKKLNSEKNYNDFVYECRPFWATIVILE
jgi:Domain of unknown function (DUF4303)